MYITMLMISSILAISSSNWPLFWLFMEINAFTFMSYIKYSSNKKSIEMNLSSEQMMIYFYINFISSILLILPLMITMNYSTVEFTMFNQLIMLMMIMAISMKLGTFPTHSWMYQISSFMSMNQMSILLTIQKIIPINLLFLINSKTMVMIGVSSSVMSCLMAYYSFSPSPFLVTSSLNSTGWLTVCSYSNMNTTITFFTIYSLMVILLAKEMKYMSNSSIVNMNKYSWNFILIMFSMIGIPPLMGFIPKLLAMKELSMVNMNLTMIMLIMSTGFMAWIYISALMSPTLSNLNQKKESFSMKIMMIQMIIPSILIMNLINN